MTSSDEPQPPGGPLRQDAPEGGLAPGGEPEELPEGETEHGSDDSRDVPAVTHTDEQSDDEAALQRENAETSQDQPSQ